MNRTSKYFVLPTCYIAFNAKVGSSSLARAIIRDFYPEIEAQLQRAAFPVGKNPDNTQWQGQCPATDAPDKQVLVLIREPIARFRSAIAQFNNVDVDLVLAAMGTNGTVDHSTVNNRISKLNPGQNIHFSHQNSLLQVKDVIVKLYKFPDHLDNLAAEAGLTLPLPIINEAKREKPTLTQEQESRILSYYAKDKEIFDSITVAGTEYIPVIENEAVAAGQPVSLTPEQIAEQIAVLQAQLDALKGQME